VAVQVADGADWFSEDLEFPGGFDHCLILWFNLVLLRAQVLNVKLNLNPI
jgi:hypothetical protein